MYHGERFNSISHLLGAVMALVGLVVLVVFASLQGDPWKIVSFSVYGASLVLLYMASALYHSFRGKAKAFFQLLDHQAIYLLIAGTYTPFALVTLRGGWGWSLFGVVWGLALLGLVIDALPATRKGRRFLPLAIYLVMGWLCLAALGPLLERLPTAGFVLLLSGGLFYTTGIGFYLLDGRVRHFHGIWHLFVLAGSICHFFAILLYLE
ncbi:MAG: hemolysin III family protein [Desulfoprunum sp.]|nr:hemolysin III family protein [Desulfoprunum sp.]